MAWNAKDQYSSYGEYNDSQFYGAGGGSDASAYDMYDDPQNQSSDPYAGQWEGHGPSYGFYDPTAFQQPSPNPAPQARGPAAKAGPVPPPLINPNNLIANPLVTDMAMQYGQDLVGRGQEELKKNLDKFVSIGQLKYYFAVDTNYVGRKIGLLLFPFSRSDWSLRYNAEEPVQPKFDLNAPDLYIPTMAYVTYVLLVGYILGLKNAFSYKYVSMIVALLTGLVLHTKGYYIALIYLSAALAFFLLRTLKLRIEPEVHGMQVHGKRKLYMIMFYAVLQPLFIWCQ